MNEPIEFRLNSSSAAEIAEHLSHCDVDFMPTLGERVEIDDYAKKIASRATCFEAWSGNVLVGLVAIYCDNQFKRIAHITNVSVLRSWTGKGIATCLMERCLEHTNTLGMRTISLEVSNSNLTAIRLYERIGFVAVTVPAPITAMHLHLKTWGKT